MRRSLLLVVGLAGVAAAATLAAPHAGPEATAGAAREALVLARGEAARARQRAALLDREAQASTRASERATIEAAALAARVQQAEAALGAAEASLAVLRQQRSALDSRLARERAPVAGLLAALQSWARRPALLTLVQPGSLEDAVHLRAAFAGVQPQIEARTATLRRDLQRARALEAEAASLAAQRQALISDLAQRRGDLASLSAAERLKARRAAGAADREAERALAIGEEARDLSALVRRLTMQPRAAQVSAGRVAAAERSAGRTGVALAGYRLPAEGSLLPQAETGKGSLTVISRPGALVVAPAAGRIAFAGPYRGYGMIVIIEHPGGWTSLITGLAAAQAAVGQGVIVGSPLGQAPARNPRITLELRRNGERTNPLDQLR